METLILIFPTLPGMDESNKIMPLSLLYVSTPLRHRFDIRILDQRLDEDWRHTLENELQSDRVICAGISTMTGPQIQGAIEAASIIRRLSPGVPIVWGGVHPSLAPEQTLEHELVDIIVVGDGEETFRELVEAIHKGEDKKNVKGLVYKEGELIISTPPRKQFPLDQIDMPAYDLVDVGQYHFVPPWIQKVCLPVITSRGCPFRCTYCYATQFSQNKYTCLPPERTVELISRLTGKFDIPNVALLDDNFFVNPERVRRICELLIESDRKIGIHNANCRVDSILRMDHELLSMVRRAGIEQLFVGVESGSNEILARIKKQITVDQVMEASAKLKRAGIKAFYSFIAGLPFESVDNIKETLTLMRRIMKADENAVVYKLQLYTPYPGTELYHYAADLMQLPETLEEWAGYHYANVNYDGFSPEHKKFLVDMSEYSEFLDHKMMGGHSRIRGLIARVYSNMLAFRIDRDFYSFRYELYPLRLLKKIRNGSA
jgi:radical SAM superfamily enzyme YgiQ (UPF0313 family)